MGQDDELKILIEASLDEVKSLQNILADLKQLQNKIKTYRLKVLAGLDKDASARQIKNDLAQITKTKSKVKIVGEVDKSTTRKNVDTAIKNLKNAEVKLTGVLDSSTTQRNVQQQLRQIPKLETTANVNVSGGNEVDKLRSQVANAGESAAGMASKIYIARSALQLLRRMAVEAKETIIELDSAVTDLGMATGQSRDKTYELLQDYNKLAGQLGSTTTQVAQAADQWLRQGHSISDTTTLIEDAMVLSKVSQLDSAAATEYLTSAMKGYKVAAQDVIGVVDKLAAVDLESATDAGGLAEAMSRTAVTANMAGISVDRLLGYLATVGEVTQKSMSSVGESFKTIFTRMSDIKANKLELIDEDGTTEMLSDVEMTLKNVGIDLRKTVNEYNNYGDVLDNLAAKWDTLSQVQQNALAKAFAGTRQGENFRALMENYSAAAKYMSIAADSAGTATEKFSLYVDSIEAKSARFIAALEGLTLDTIDGDFVGDLVDAGTAIIELIEKMDILKAALVSLGAGAVLKGVSAISSGFLAAKQNIQNLGEAVQTLRNVQNAGALSAETITRLGGLTKGLTDEQLRLVLSTQQLTTAQMTQILTAGGLTEAAAAAKLQTLGFATAEGTATAATFTLSGAMTGLGTAIKAAFASNPVGMIMLAVGAAYELVKGVMAIYDAVTVTAEEATGAMEKSFSEFEEAENKVQSLNDELQTTQDRIDELNAKDALTFVEESELQKLRESVELLQIQADLAEKERIRAAKESAGDIITAYRKNFKHDISADAVQEYMDYSNTSGNNVALFADENNVSAMLAGIQQMKRLRDELDKSSEYYQEDYQHFQGIIDDATDSIWEQINVLGTYKRNLEAIPYDELTDNQKAALDEINAVIELVYKALDPAKWNEIQWGNIVSDEKYSDDVKKLNELAAQSEITADTIKEQFPALAQACTDAGIVVEDIVDNINASFKSADEDGVSTYTAQLSDLSDAISGLRSSYDLLESAQKDMSDGGGLSPETIEKLAKAEANYLDYISEENGVVKLNTKAWEENAKSKANAGTVDELQKEINSIKNRNEELQKSIAYYKEQRALGSDGGIWNNLIAEAEGELATNNEQLERTEELLRIIQTLFGDVTSEADTLYKSLSSVKSAMSSLASACNELSEDGSVSYSTLSNIADAFADTVPNIDQYISRLAAANGNSEDAAEAINELVNALISAKMSTEELANADENVIAAMLEEVGVVNAAEHAHWLVTDAKAKNILATYDLTNATEDSLAALLNEIQGLLGEGDAAQFAEKYVAALRMEQILCNQNALDSTDSVNSLIAIAAAAGASTTALSKLAMAKEAIANGTAAGFHMLDQMGDIQAAAEKEARDIVSSLKNSVSAAFTGTSTYKFKSNSSGSKSSKSSSKEIEEYVAELDPLYEKLQAIQKLEDEISRENAKANLLEDNDFDGRIEHHKSLVQMYEKEQTALHALAESRRELISANLQTLSARGIEYDYDAANNTILIHNMERINELSATTKGKYDTLQEATNALRKETEDLIGTTVDMVEANRENSDSWWELQSSIKSARSDIVDTLIAMADAANDAVDSIQNVSDVLSDAAQEFADNDGWISIDTFQAIRDLGTEYMQMLINENNELVINRDRINDIIEAKTVNANMKL